MGFQIKYKDKVENIEKSQDKGRIAEVTQGKCPEERNKLLLVSLTKGMKGVRQDVMLKLAIYINIFTNVKKVRKHG